MLSVDDFGWRSSLDDDAPVPLAGQSCASDYSSRQPQSSFMAVPRVTGPLLQAIAATTAWLKQANTSAAVIGGVAASLLGRPRVQKTWT